MKAKVIPLVIGAPENRKLSSYTLLESSKRFLMFKETYCYCTSTIEICCQNSVLQYQIIIILLLIIIIIITIIIIIIIIITIMIMITKYNGYSQSLSDVLSVFLFYNSYCNTINSVEKYINKPTNTYE